jgi:hypothetical protein
MERARILFGCYRRGDANDPDQYVASIAAVLTLYDRALIREVTDPRSGISTDEKHCDYMPNSGQLKVYCDTIRDRKFRMARLAAMPAMRPVIPLPPDRSTPGRRAKLFVHADAPQYARCVMLAETADTADWKYDENGRPGIWVAHNLLYEAPPQKTMKQIAAPTDDELRRIYGSKAQEFAE